VSFHGGIHDAGHNGSIVKHSRMGNSHVDTEPREHRRALDVVFFIATAMATPEPSSTSSLAKSTIGKTNATTIRSQTSCSDEFPGKTGRHASADNATLFLDRQVVGMDNKASLRELSSIEVWNAIEIRVHGRDEFNGI